MNDSVECKWYLEYRRISDIYDGSWERRGVAFDTAEDVIGALVDMHNNDDNHSFEVRAVRVTTITSESVDLIIDSNDLEW